MKESYREGVASHSGPEPCEGGGSVALAALDREVGSPKPLIGTSLDGGFYRECALWAWKRQCGVEVWSTPAPFGDRRTIQYP